MKKKRGPVRIWLTAFILSPGMIFTQAYFLLWLSTNVWLDHAFKQHLKQVFVAETGQGYQLDVRSLRTGPGLNSIILKKLELFRVDPAENQQNEQTTREISELRIDCPNLSFLPFRPSDEMLSLQKVSERIISRSNQ
ncbi:MAG TPA: hypothetical protein ENL07_09460 [Chlorobaculum parvum]|uniref:Uncharacterized protein n=1 Tax=Chlorobaculum parvum TaxID=274539 RepID=A0A7C5HJZ9_9CHLB|nr:hypothetical protein [Chlorobaculum parvum]